MQPCNKINLLWYYLKWCFLQLNGIKWQKLLIYALCCFRPHCRPCHLKSCRFRNCVGWSHLPPWITCIPPEHHKIIKTQRISIIFKYFIGNYVACKNYTQKENNLFIHLTRSHFSLIAKTYVAIGTCCLFVVLVSNCALFSMDSSDVSLPVSLMFKWTWPFATSLLLWALLHCTMSFVISTLFTFANKSTDSSNSESTGSTLCTIIMFWYWRQFFFEHIVKLFRLFSRVFIWVWNFLQEWGSSFSFTDIFGTVPTLTGWTPHINFVPRNLPLVFWIITTGYTLGGTCVVTHRKSDWITSIAILNICDNINNVISYPHVGVPSIRHRYCCNVSLHCASCSHRSTCRRP